VEDGEIVLKIGGQLPIAGRTETVQAFVGLGQKQRTR